MNDHADYRVIDFESDSPEVWRLYPTFSGNLAFDIGANGGLVADILAHNFKRVVAFEPHPISYRYLAMHARSNVQTLELAVSNRAGELRLDVSAGAEANGMLTSGEVLRPYWGDKTGTMTVTATTIDDLVKVYGNPDFIKIDTEGHEAEVVRGGFQFFTHHKPQMVIEIHSQDAGDRVRELLWEYDFTKYTHPAHKVSKFHQANCYWLVG